MGLSRMAFLPLGILPQWVWPSTETKWHSLGIALMNWTTAFSYMRIHFARTEKRTFRLSASKLEN